MRAERLFWAGQLISGFEKGNVVFKEKIFGHVKKRYVAGLFVMISLGITIFILRFLFGVAGN